MQVDSLKVGCIIKVSWTNHSKVFVILSVCKKQSPYIFSLSSEDKAEEYVMYVIPEVFSAHRQQTENYTLMNKKGDVLSIDAKIEIIE